MKHLKHFNEELNPQKYIRAGSKLSTLGKTSRGSKLIDYGYEKSWGFYNVHIGNMGDSSWGVYTAKLTNPACRFHYGLPQWNAQQTNNTSTIIETQDEEDLLNNWTDGRETLSFTLEFTMQLSEESRLDMISKGKINKGWYSSNRIPLFAIHVELSDWYEGLREYNYMEEDNEYLRPGDENYHDVSMMYANTSHTTLTLMPLFTKNYFGIFADRKSAIKFKRELPKLVDPHKSQIMDILSLVSGSTDNLENIIGKIYNMSINYLYQDEVPRGLGSSAYRDSWFYKSFR